MANVILKNIKKIYPHSNETKKDKAALKDQTKINLQITEEGVVAVQEFNLEIADKEFIVLVGPSGCGKSTTLRMIAGLEDITEGELFIDDELVNDVAPKDRDIAMVFQNYALYPHKTVYDNMAFALKMRKVSKTEVDEKVKEAAEILGITELLNRKPKALSGGQRQRVAIGRAIVRQPQVFLMDEPLSNLDAKLRNQMRAELIKLRQTVDTTFVYVTHDQTEAMTLGDRIVIMKDGFIQQIGTPQQVFHEPLNKFVAGFIGAPQMNFVSASLKLHDNKYCVEFLDLSIQLSDKQQKILQERKQPTTNISLGVRPEHVRISTQNVENSINAKIDISELMGSEALLHLDVQGKTFTVKVPITDVEISNELMFSRGNSVFVSFAAETLHLFDPDSENNLLM